MDYEKLLLRIIKDRNLIEDIYDLIRLIDPVNKKVFTYGKSSRLKAADIHDPCYCIWGTSACKNCISARALNQNRTLVKMEFKDNKVFLVTSVPVENENERVVIELLKDITESGLLDVEGRDASDLKKLVSRRNIGIITDAIARIYNREFIYERLPFDISMSNMENKPLALIYLKLNNLEEINTLRGFEAGEYVIRKIAKIIKYYQKDENDWTARFENDGFVILLHNIDEKQIYQICKRLNDKIEKTEIVFSGKRIYMEKSIGFYILRSENITAEELIKNTVITIGNKIPGNINNEPKDRFFNNFYLTAREREIAELILEGYSNVNIAKELFVGVPTVKKHVTAIYNKAGTKTRNEFFAKFKH